jgi:hypothetical protein
VRWQMLRFEFALSVPKKINIWFLTLLEVLAVELIFAASPKSLHIL